MKGIRYDAVLKDLFERDRPSLLTELTGGVPIRAFLNVEIPKMIDRRVDSVAQLENGRICHIEFQSQNHRRMPYRQGIYGLLIADKFQTKVDQTVIYTGSAPMRMKDSLDAGSVQVSYRLIDIRTYSAEALSHSKNPADRALAILGGGSEERVRQVVEAAAALPHEERERALAQLNMLAGLRGLSQRVTMEMKSMSQVATIHNNAFLKWVHDDAKLEGIAEGRVQMLGSLLNSKFGPLPVWATKRLTNATPEQLDEWVPKLTTATTLEDIVGRRRT